MRRDRMIRRSDDLKVAAAKDKAVKALEGAGLTKVSVGLSRKTGGVTVIAVRVPSNKDVDVLAVEQVLALADLDVPFEVKMIGHITKRKEK